MLLYCSLSEGMRTTVLLREARMHEKQQRENEAMKAKTGKQCRKKGAVVPALLYRHREVKADIE